ncbi:hypothetical protein [Rehaibacterium terrae]|mgnify:CR=1 FL=1|jgi:hypothetical protein|uniref:Uncharacterized protein n=1 Tax=Rehaibacterium terrae TaxID=1341696 RepID=A0A7W8DEJ2_9GAMM|nr:hypothetical protein [Rehaibacterium terrae]MBB5015514.1 hypothetical protein [Rehaibacterium terrae]
MTLQSLLVVLLVGGIAGWLAGPGRAGLSPIGRAAVVGLQRKEERGRVCRYATER